MGKITDIVRQKRNKTRVSIFIDGEFVTGLDAVALAQARVNIGDELDPSELKTIVHKSEVNGAFDRAVGYISHMPRSRRETERYLRDKNYAKEVISEVVEKLIDYRYLDDRAYAQTYARQKSAKYGMFRIRAELKLKGVSDEIIAEIADDGGDDADGALAAARKYVSARRTPEILKLKRFLAGRGFSWDGISSAVRALKSEGVFDVETDDDYD